jgi:hypothetical protein
MLSICSFNDTQPVMAIPSLAPSSSYNLLIKERRVRLSPGASPKSIESVFYTLSMYCLSFSTLSSLSRKRGTTHRRPPNPHTLSLQCILMRPLHPTRSRHPPLVCRTGSPFRCSPTRYVASGAHSGRHSPARRPPQRSGARSPGRHSPARRPPRRSPAQHPAGARLPSTGGQRWQ